MSTPPGTQGESLFERSVASVLQHEGGFVDHPFDPGGATKFGITRRVLERWRGRAVSKDVRCLQRAEAVEIYRDLYWDAVRADELPAGVSLALFDFAVNSGVSRAVRHLQAALGIDRDGILGPQTIEAARSADPRALVRGLSRARLGFLARLPTWSIFGRGWRRRVLSVERQALELAASYHSPTSQGTTT